MNRFFMHARMFSGVHVCTLYQYNDPPSTHSLHRCIVLKLQFSWKCVDCISGGNPDTYQRKWKNNLATTAIP